MEEPEEKYSGYLRSIGSEEQLPSQKYRSESYIGYGKRDDRFYDPGTEYEKSSTSKYQCDTVGESENSCEPKYFSPRYKYEKYR